MTLASWIRNKSASTKSIGTKFITLLHEKSNRLRFDFPLSGSGSPIVQQKSNIIIDKNLLSKQNQNSEQQIKSKEI